MHSYLHQRALWLESAHQKCFIGPIFTGHFHQFYNNDSLSHCHTYKLYWVIQAGLLSPLTFARHRLSPLAAFTSGAYFLHNGRR